MEFIRGQEFILLEDITPMDGEPAYAVRDGVIPEGWILRFVAMTEIGHPLFYYNKEDGSTLHNMIILPLEQIDRFVKPKETETIEHG